MSTEDNKAATRRLFDGFNKKGVAIVDELYTPDFVLHDPGSPTPAGGVNSREDFKQFLSGFFASLPGQFTIDDMIAEGIRLLPAGRIAVPTRGSGGVYLLPAKK